MQDKEHALDSNLISRRFSKIAYRYCKKINLIKLPLYKILRTTTVEYVYKCDNFPFNLMQICAAVNTYLQNVSI
jgi:hypothetical protein